jgi:hypothetical protein
MIWTGRRVIGDMHKQMLTALLQRHRRLMTNLGYTTQEASTTKDTIICP